MFRFKKYFCFCCVAKGNNSNEEYDENYVSYKSNQYYKIRYNL